MKSIEFTQKFWEQRKPFLGRKLKNLSRAVGNLELGRLVICTLFRLLRNQGEKCLGWNGRTEGWSQLSQCQLGAILTFLALPWAPALLSWWNSNSNGMFRQDFFAFLIISQVIPKKCKSAVCRSQKLDGTSWLLSSHPVIAGTSSHNLLFTSLQLLHVFSSHFLPAVSLPADLIFHVIHEICSIYSIFHWSKVSLVLEQDHLRSLNFYSALKKSQTHCLVWKVLFSLWDPEQG